MCIYSTYYMYMYMYKSCIMIAYMKLSKYLYRHIYIKYLLLYTISMYTVTGIEAQHGH